MACVILRPVPGSGDDEGRLGPLDCGIQSLYLLLHFSGERTDLSTLERALPAARSSNYSMSELQAADRKLGLALRGIPFGKDDVPPDRPAIASMSGSNDAHYVVLRPVGRTGTMVQVIDPPYAPQVVDSTDLIGGPAWTGRLLIPGRSYERGRGGPDPSA